MAIDSLIPLRLELQHLLQQLTQLVHEMGNRHRQPTPPGSPIILVSTADLRPTYLRLLQQAASVAQQLGVDEVEASTYVTNQLVAHLRANRSQIPTHP